MLGLTPIMIVKFDPSRGIFRVMIGQDMKKERGNGLFHGK